MERRLGIPEVLVAVGGCVFIVVLFVSAVFEADIRWLHFFQAWMYVVAIALTLRGNRWGYFVGFSAAALWDYTSLFVNNFFISGLRELSNWIESGHLTRPDQLIAVPAWVGNLLVVVGCGWAYYRHTTERKGDWLRLLVAFSLTTAFFAADMAIFQPRYLALFPRLLHPHNPLN
jgi:hypothetical protein